MYLKNSQLVFLSCFPVNNQFKGNIGLDKTYFQRNVLFCLSYPLACCCYFLTEKKNANGIGKINSDKKEPYY